MWVYQRVPFCFRCVPVLYDCMFSNKGFMISVVICVNTFLRCVSLFCSVDCMRAENEILFVEDSLVFALLSS